MPLLSKLAGRLFALIFPNRCLNCHKITPLKYFCEKCGDVTAYITVKTCPDCGLPPKHCACKWNFYYFDEMISCFEADEPTKSSFYSFKFGGNRGGGKFFSAQMVKRISPVLERCDIDFITSVPSHKSTVAKRGYDQVKLLARDISKGTKIKYQSLLSQPKKAAKQHESNKISDRFLNVTGKYKILREEKIKDKNILLVDDIKTTGATLNQCARELKLAGANKVLAITALTVYPQKDSVENS